MQIERLAVWGIGIGLAMASSVAGAQTPDQIRQAAEARFATHTAAVLACAPGRPAIPVRVPFAPTGMVSGVEPGPGAPLPFFDCVMRALAAVELPGSVPAGTAVQYTFQGRPAAPPPVAPPPAAPPPAEPPPV